MLVRDLPRKASFLVDSQDVKPLQNAITILDYFEGYNAFYVVQDGDGDTTVWGMFGIVPYLNCRLYRCEMLAS